LLQIINIALPFFGLILLGVLAARIWKLDESGLAWLNVFVVYFALPALIFSVVAATPLERLVNPSFVAATGGVTVFCFLLMVVVGWRVLHFDLRTAALQGTAASYGNVGYMGLPLAVAFFGPEAAVPAALIFCFDCTVQFLLTAVLVGLSDEKQESSAHIAMRIGKDIVTHPFIVSTMLGILASGFDVKPSGGLQTIIDMLMRAAGPVALFAMGVTVALRKLESVGRELPVLAFIKIALHPALAFLAVAWFAVPDPIWLNVAVMMAALPTASNAFILARQYGAYVAGAGAAVIATTVLSVLTIPLIVYALQVLRPVS
jgi:malonate transporter and related proteins